jgi:hypothetical protein
MSKLNERIAAAAIGQAELDFGPGHFTFKFECASCGEVETVIHADLPLNSSRREALENLVRRAHEGNHLPANQLKARVDRNEKSN